MTSHGDRSRSPKRTTWISKAVAGFGRYPDKRPKGLYADDTGAFRVEDLMYYWGHDQGLTEQQLLTALRDHMFHEGEGAGHLRFAIDSDAKGHIVVRVQPPKRKESNGQCATPARARWRQQRGGSEADEMMGAVDIVADLPVSEKLDMSLEDMIKIGRREERPLKMPTELRPRTWHSSGDWAARDTEWTRWHSDQPEAYSRNEEGHSSAAYARLRAEKVRHRVEQMGLTPGSRHIREPGRNRESRREAEGSGPSPHLATWEKIQRWVGWVVKKGYKQLGLDLSDGWVHLEALAKAMHESRPDFGLLDAVGLRAVLKDNDAIGRFETDGQRVRKVPRDERRGDRGRGSHRQPHGWGRQGLASASTRRCDREASDPGESEDDSDAASAPRAPQGAGNRPTPSIPPGEHWTKYQDDGVMWWYYEGPLGKWWASSDTHMLPTPYEDATE